MRAHNNLFILAGILIFLCQGSSMALDRDSNTESKHPNKNVVDCTNVTAETMDLSMESSVMAFRENVTVANSQYILNCDTLLIKPDKNKKPESMQAVGNVRLKAENGRATCKKATYSRSSGQFILEHDAVLQQENSKLSADKITVIIKDGQFEGIRGEGNVKGSIPLKEILMDIENSSSE